MFANHSNRDILSIVKSNEGKSLIGFFLLPLTLLPVITSSSVTAEAESSWKQVCPPDILNETFDFIISNDWMRYCDIL